MPERWKRWQADHTHLRTTAIVADYAVGAGGRVCDLPPRYLDAIAESIVRRNPRNMDHRVVELLLGGRFRKSMHPQLVKHTIASFRLERHTYGAEYMRNYRKRHGVRHRVVKVSEPVIL